VSGATVEYNLPLTIPEFRRESRKNIPALSMTLAQWSADRGSALCQKITGTDWKKVLANRWNRKKITKNAHAGRGQETIWEMSV
jgi:hypothetical protein